MKNQEKYIKKYRCPKCNAIIAGKGENEEIENTTLGKIKVGQGIVTITCLKCEGIKILYLKNKKYI